MATAEQPTAAPTAQVEQPFTRADLREELAHALRNYVTRAELREELALALQNYATKQELRDELRHYATKADLAQLETRMVERMAAMESRLIRWIIGMMFGSILAAAAIASVVALLITS